MRGDWPSVLSTSTRVTNDLKNLFLHCYVINNVYYAAFVLRKVSIARNNLFWKYVVIIFYLNAACTLILNIFYKCSNFLRCKYCLTSIYGSRESGWDDNWKIKTNLLTWPSEITNHTYMWALGIHCQTTLQSLKRPGKTPETANDIVFTMPCL